MNPELPTPYNESKKDALSEQLDKQNTKENNPSYFVSPMYSLAHKFYQAYKGERLNWFKKLKRITGSYSPILTVNDNIPYPVHFREGTDVRNWMRDQTECQGWSSHDFDNNWETLVSITIDKYLK